MNIETLPFPCQGVKGRVRRQDGNPGDNASAAPADGTDGNLNGGVGGDASAQPGAPGKPGQLACMQMWSKLLYIEQNEA